MEDGGGEIGGEKKAPDKKTAKLKEIKMSMEFRVFVSMYVCVCVRERGR